MTEAAPAAEGSKSKFTFVQFGRFIAAFLVVLYHNDRLFSQEKYWADGTTFEIFSFGHSGVQFFFVLSGFIIMYVHWRDLNNPSRIVAFASRRFSRIYPAYWIVLIPLIASFLLMPASGDGHETHFDTILSSIFLLHTGTGKTVLTPAWTLYHEVLFYALFAISILHLRTGMILLAIWGAASVGALLYGGFAFPLGFYANPLNILFILGLCTAWLLRKARVPAPWLFLCFGTGMFLATGLQEVYFARLSEDVNSLLYGAASAIAILGVVELERSGRLRASPMLQLLGDASYAIYLVHYPVLSILAKAFMALGARDVPVVLAFAALATGATAAGVLFHVCIERPLLAWLRGKRRLSGRVEPIRT